MMRLRAAVCSVLVILASRHTAVAQTGGGYDLTWNSVQCGSPQNSTGGGYLLGATLGQAQAGRVTGGAYVLDGGFGPVSLAPTDAPAPDAADATALVFRLHGNAPNPFASSTSIAFSLAREGDVDVRIYDLAGRLVRTVLERSLAAGRHQAVWDGNDDDGREVAKGVYFVRLRTAGFEARKKLVLLR